MLKVLALLLFPLLSADGLLLGCTVIDSDQIRARDLVAVANEFSTLDPETIFAPAPLAGVTRVMRGGEISNLAKRMHLTLQNAPGEICFERASEPLTEIQLQPVLEQSLGISEVEILDFSHLRIPSNAVVEFPRSALLSSGYWRGRVVYDGYRVVPVWAKIKLNAGGTSSRVGADAVSGSNSPRAQPRETGRSNSDPRETGRWKYDGREEVLRGDKVDVEVQSGPAHLSFEAHAETSGRAGDSILVRNPENGRLFQAKVLAKGKVLVQR